MNSKKAISYPLLLAPFVGILVFMFSISIISETGDIEGTYGELASKTKEITDKNKVYQNLFEDVLQNSFPRRVKASYLDPDFIGRCLYEPNMLFTNYLYDERADEFCLEDFSKNSEDAKNLSNFIINYYTEELNNYFSNLEREGEIITFKLNSTNTTINLKIQTKQEASLNQKEISHNSTYKSTISYLSPQHIINSKLFEKHTFENYRLDVANCIKENNDREKCYKTNAIDHLKLEEFDLNTQIDQGESYDRIILKYYLGRENHLNFALRLKRDFEN